MTSNYPYLFIITNYIYQSQVNSHETLLKELHRSSTDLEGWSFRSSSHLSLAKALKAVQSALWYRGMTRRTCFKIIGLNLTMQEIVMVKYAGQDCDLTDERVIVCQK